MEDRRAPSSIVLIDFGIARFYRPGQVGDTAIYGTTGYAPPEQYGRGQTDARTDVYALGVLLHQVLTGHDPTSTPFALPPMRALLPGAPAHLADAITRATAIEREARFADIAAFRAALRPPAPRPSRPSNRAFNQSQHAQPKALAARRRGSALIWAMVGLLLVLLVAGALALGLFMPVRQAITTTPNTAMAVDVMPSTTSEPAASALPTPTDLPELTPAIDLAAASCPPPRPTDL